MRQSTKKKPHKDRIEFYRSPGQCHIDCVLENNHDKLLLLQPVSYFLVNLILLCCFFISLRL